MGYDSRVLGEITVTPSIPVRALAKSPFLNARTNGLSVQFYVEENATEVDEGTLIRSEVYAIAPLTNDWHKAYDLTEHLAQAVRRIREAGSECAGELVRLGRQTGDIERYIVRAGDDEVVVEKARLSWPDGTEVTLP